MTRTITILDGDELFSYQFPDDTTLEDMQRSMLQPMPQEIIAAITEDKSAATEIKGTYLATITTLEQIEAAASPTNAQVIAAVKFMAKTLRLLLKLLARQFK
jgi:hypothetical protein